MKKSDKLQQTIEKALMELLGGKMDKPEADRREIRSNISLAIKWQAVKLKMNEEDWGSGFKDGGTGKDTEEESEIDDE